MRRRIASCFLAGTLAVSGSAVSADEGAPSGFGRWLRNPFSKEKSADSPSSTKGTAEVPPVRIAPSLPPDNTSRPNNPARNPAAQTISTPRRIGAATPRVAEPDATTPSINGPTPSPSRPPLFTRRMPSARAARGTLSDEEESSQPILRVPPPDRSSTGFAGQPTDTPPAVAQPTEAPRRRLIPLTGNVEPPRARGPAMTTRSNAPPFVIESGEAEINEGETPISPEAPAQPTESDLSNPPNAAAPATNSQRPLLIMRRGLFGVREANPASAQQPKEEPPPSENSPPLGPTLSAKRGNARGRNASGESVPGLAIESGEVAEAPVAPSDEPTAPGATSDPAEGGSPTVSAAASPTEENVEVAEEEVIEQPRVSARPPRGSGATRVNQPALDVSAPKEKAASETPPEKPSMTQRWKSWWGSKK